MHVFGFVLPAIPDSWITMTTQATALVVALTALVVGIRALLATVRNSKHIEDTATAVSYLNRENNANPTTENVPADVADKVKKIANGHGAPPKGQP